MHNILEVSKIYIMAMYFCFDLFECSKLIYSTTINERVIVKFFISIYLFRFVTLMYNKIEG